MNAGNAGHDPGNQFLWRQNRRRLDVEQIRDALLFVSGQLDLSGHRSLGDLERNEDYYRAIDGSFEKPSRAIYLPVVRANGYEMFSTFDAADPAVHHEQRAATVVPGQALFLMNNPVALQAARKLAAVVSVEPPGDLHTRLEGLYFRLFGRPVRASEAALCLSHLQAQEETSGPTSDPAVAWERLCRVLLAANEFIYID